MPLIVPPNLVGRDSFVYNGAFNLGTEGWEGSGGTIDFVTTSKKYSVGSLKVTVNGSNVGARQKRDNGYVVTPGRNYLADIACMAATGSDEIEVHLQVAQYKSDNTFISAADSGQLILNEEEWKIAPASFMANAEAAYVLLHGITWGAQEGTFFIGGARIRPADR